MNCIKIYTIDGRVMVLDDAQLDQYNAMLKRLTEEGSFRIDRGHVVNGLKIMTFFKETITRLEYHIGEGNE